MEESKLGASHQVVFNDFTSRKLERMLCFFTHFELIVEIGRIADIHVHAIVASVLFKTITP